MSAVRIATRGRVQMTAVSLATSGWLTYAQIIPPQFPSGGIPDYQYDKKIHKFNRLADELEWTQALECMLKLTN